MQNVTVRHSGADDQAALHRLAALDSASPPTGPALIAESGSRILAALPMGGGRPIADPFEPTAELVALLKLREAQIAFADADRAEAGGRLRSLLRGRVTHVRA